MAEWSKAPALGAGLFGGAGSNPASVIFFFIIMPPVCSPPSTYPSSLCVTTCKENLNLVSQNNMKKIMKIINMSRNQHSIVLYYD